MNIIGLGCISSLGEGVSTFADLETISVPLPTYAFDEPILSDTRFYQGVLKNNIANSSYRLALHACDEALSDSREKNDITSNNIALIIATGAGDTENIENPETEHNTAYDIAEKISRKLGLIGVFCTVSNACSSAGYAMDMAQELLTCGHDAVLLCGVEARSVTSQATFKSLRVIDPLSCRPFSDDRKGTVLGCGAAALVLTSEHSFQMDTDSNIYAKVLSTALNSDAYHPTSPEPSGFYMRQCISSALTDADINPDQINLFVPHATGTRLNDEIEQHLLSELCPKTFGIEKTILLKKYIGHTGGASAAFSYLVAALLLWKFKLSALKNKHFFALVNATAFGGNNCSSVLSSSNFEQKHKVF